MDVYNSEGSAYDPAVQMEVKSAPVPTTGSNSGPTNGHENGRSNEQPSQSKRPPLRAPRMKTFSPAGWSHSPSVYDMAGMYL